MLLRSTWLRSACGVFSEAMPTSLHRFKQLRDIPVTPCDKTSLPQGAPLAANTAVVTEVELLKQARSALSGDPLQAFALSERCRAQYPNGAFAQEREYIAISALVRLGRTDEARSRASLFRMHYPSSAYLPRLARMLGE